MQDNSVLTIMYLASTSQSEYFAKLVKGKINVKIGTLPDFGSASFFDPIEKLVKNNTVQYVIFHIPSLESQYTRHIIATKIVDIAKNNKNTDKFLVVIVDPEEAFNDDGRTKLTNVGCMFVNDESEINETFAILDEDEMNNEQLEDHIEAIDEELFGDLLTTTKPSQMPVVNESTPQELTKSIQDPFAELMASQNSDENPFENEQDVTDEQNSGVDLDVLTTLINIGGDASVIVDENDDPFSDEEHQESQPIDIWEDEFSKPYVEDEDNEIVPLEELLERYGHKLSDSDFAKLQSMIEPETDYSLEEQDRIGKKGILKTATGKNKLVGGLSQVGEHELASSSYTAAMQAEHGYYSPPDECKIISVWGCKGGLGKALANNTEILVTDKNGQNTKNKPIKDLTVGEYVFDIDKNPSKVLGVHPQPELLKTLNFKLSDGKEVICTEDHLWNVFVDNEYKTLTTLEIKQHLQCGIKISVANLESSPCYSAYNTKRGNIVNYDDSFDTGNPYYAGVIFGNNYGKILRTTDEYVLYNLVNKSNNKYSIIKNTETTYELIYPQNEEINPFHYLNQHAKNRKSFLQGFLDVAGTVDNGKIIVNVPINYAHSIRTLFTDLGYWLTENKNSNSTTFVIDTDDYDIVTSPYKKEELFNTQYLLRRNIEKIDVESIEYTGKEEKCTCIYIDSPSHSYLLSNMIPTHNTTVSVMIATQLNWFFNSTLMQRMATTFEARVLILSINEFDDLTTHGIGYDSYLSEENETDGHNILELLDCIKDADGIPSWGDISQCFVMNDANKIFYLPSLTQREEVNYGQMNIVSAEDYKTIIEVCSRFFQFIVIDTPDIFYHEREDLMNMAFNLADIICFVLEANAAATLNLFHFMDAIKDESGRVALDTEKCILVVNKYVQANNPYMQIPPQGQIKYSTITSKTAKYFSKFVMIPYTQPRAIGNVLYGTDAKVKQAAAELTDYILELIDENDRKKNTRLSHEFGIF